MDEQMPPETPLAFGLHPNAEIGFKLREAETFCNSLVQLQPREAGGEGGMSVEVRRGAGCVMSNGEGGCLVAVAGVYRC
jgi:hypothetical protein